MKVKFGNYILSADKHQFILSAIGKTESGKEKLENYYYPRLEQAIDRIFEIELSESDAKTLNDIYTIMMSTRRLVKTAGFTKEDFQ